MRSLQCSRCGEKMSCGAGADACWCQAFPALPATALDGRSDCMCAACLRQLHLALGTDKALLPAGEAQAVTASGLSRPGASVSRS